jgi:hypothetical protein
VLGIEFSMLSMQSTTKLHSHTQPLIFLMLLIVVFILISLRPSLGLYDKAQDSVASETLGFLVP